MKLFYTNGACSLASHIVLNEVKKDFFLESVDLTTGLTSSGQLLSSINPKNKVPVLQLDSGEVLTEGVAILQYIADTHPTSNLVPKAGTLERARVQEYLNFFSTEYHKAFAPFFDSTATDKQKAAASISVEMQLAYLETIVSTEKTYLMGETFTVADAYLFVITSWTEYVGINLNAWPALSAYMQRVAKRAAVEKSMLTESLKGNLHEQP